LSAQSWSLGPQRSSLGGGERWEGWEGWEAWEGWEGWEGGRRLAGREGGSEQ